MTDFANRMAELGQCYSGVVHDIMRAMGLRNFTLPHDITPLMPEKTLCGPAFTIEGRLDDTADAHQTLLEWTGLLSKAPFGHIWVSQPHMQDLAQMGELSAETQKNKGVPGGRPISNGIATRPDGPGLGRDLDRDLIETSKLELL